MFSCAEWSAKIPSTALWHARGTSVAGKVNNGGVILCRGTGHHMRTHAVSQVIARPQESVPSCSGVCNRCQPELSHVRLCPVECGNVAIPGGVHKKDPSEVRDNPPPNVRMGQRRSHTCPDGQTPSCTVCVPQPARTRDQRGRSPHFAFRISIPRGKKSKREKRHSHIAVVAERNHSSRIVTQERVQPTGLRLDHLAVERVELEIEHRIEVQDSRYLSTSTAI
jgi:hypothetical protein